MRYGTYALPIAGLLAVGVVAVGLPGDAASTRQPSQSRENHPTGTLATDHTNYARSGTVTFKFAVTNPTNSAIHFDFDTAQQFDITVTDPHGVETWRWSQDRVFAQMLTAIDLKPGQSKVYTVTWDTAGARALPAGTYTATAKLIPVMRQAVRGGILVNPDVDPNNMGQPNRANRVGAAFEVNATPAVSANTSFTISG